MGGIKLRSLIRMCRLRLKPNLHVFGASRVFQLGVSHRLWTIV
jgi:hypothetical protein